MPFLNGFQITSNKVVTDSTPVGALSHFSGRTYDQTVANSLAVNTAGTSVARAVGISRDTAGSIMIVDASGGLPAGTIVHNGLPIVSSTGKLCTDAIGAVTHFHQGVPFTAVGAVAIS